MINSQKTVFFKAVRELPNTEESDRLNSILNIFKGVEEFVLDVSGTIVSSNLEAVTITGYEEWEVIGRHFSIFYTTEDQIKRQFEDDLEKASRQGYCYSTGLRMKKRNSPFWAKVKLEALYSDDQIVSGFRLTLQDATHKALYSHNLSLVKDEYLNLFNNPFIGIFKFRMADFKVLLANEKAEAILGPDWKELYINTIFSDNLRFRQFIQQLQADKKVENDEFQLHVSANKPIWVSISAKYFENAGFVEGVIMDITQRKLEHERTLHLSNELEAFIYHASHDLRSPITSLYGLVNLIKKESTPEKINEYAQLMDGRILHLDNIIRDMVEIAYNTAVPLENKSVDLKDELDLVVYQQSKTYGHVKSYISVEIDPGAQLITDQSRLRSILRNVVSNAFKYNNPTQQDCRVSIDARIAETETSITVEDNGIGIPVEQQAKLFSLFYRANSSHKGNGLGLYIAKTMATKLGGDLVLHSTLGKGTSIKILIPTVKTHLYESIAGE
jgi:PAS domain S-box-containing protein